MAYRSENDKIGNKKSYTDLNMSQYPETLDTRLNNKNMKGFVNVGEEQLADWVMAEYVNASLDAIMAVERALGVKPMVPYDTAPGSVSAIVESSNVSERIKRIENGLFDERYGGSGWRYIGTRPTLSSHNHDGLDGHPGKIDLQKEIEGLLLKKNIELSAERGLTGADIFLSPNNLVKINDALDDFLSKAKGGDIYGAVTFNKGVKTRNSYDVTAEEMESLSGTSLGADTKASGNKSLSVSSAGSTVRMFKMSAFERQEMLYGKYFCAVRIKLTSSTSGSVFRFSLGGNTQTVDASELSVGNYKQIYFVFEQDEKSFGSDLTLEKLATPGSVGVSLDSVFIQPIHPAVLDR